MSERAGKTRIAVLGGGIGSLSAVYALTSEPGWEERYEITVYQLGWRLGGKAASGRNAALNERSEGRGAHLWFGFYENALGMMREVYRSLGRAPGTPLASFKEAFAVGKALHLASGAGHRPTWPLALPPNDEAPGTGIPLPSMWSYVGQMLAWIVDSIPHLHEDYGDYAALLSAWDSGARGILCGLVERAQSLGITSYGEDRPASGGLADSMLLRAAAAGATIDEELGDHQLCRAWAAPLLFLAEECFSRLADEPDGILYPLFLGPLKLGLALVRGILGDRLYTPGRGLEAIEGEEFRSWLANHGASQELRDHPLVGALYAAFFAYEGGDAERPSIAAGTMTQLILRLFFTYRGALYYTPAAGAGEVVFAPLYLLLRDRGVRFRFFHKVKALHVADGEDAIEAITISRQVVLKRRRGGYDPLVGIKGLPCWPSTPRWEQIVLGHDPAVQALDFEAADSPEVEVFRLRRGQHFDKVILGIPPGGLAKVCRSLVRRAPRWEAMLANLRTVAVGGIQLWLYSNWAELTGDPEPPLAGSNFPTPFVSWTNNSSVIPYEVWTGKYWPGSVACLEATIPDAMLSPDEDGDGVGERWLRAQAKRWLSSHTRSLWPEGTAGFTSGIDWSLLVDPERRMGEGRFEGQHLWSSTKGAGRQVLSLPGTARFRLRADRSGFSNLLLAGDWTDTGLNLGCIEAATISGFQASRAICAAPAVIIGESKEEDVLAESPPPRVRSPGLETVKIAALS